MNLRTLALPIACLLSGIVSSVHAQTTQAADYIVVVVNAEPITNGELRAEVKRVEQRIVQQRQTPPAPDVLRREVLERMINDRAQIQLARETGIKVDGPAIDQAEQSVARQNQIDVAELHRRLAKDGLDVPTFRAQLRDQLLQQRLQERDVEGRIRISEGDIDRALAEQQKANTDPFVQDINLAQILIAIPENGPPSQVPALLKQAQNVLERIRKGEDFSALVEEVSAAERTRGGQLGLRRADRYPRSFVLATQDLGVGGVSDIVRSGAGFHILKVIEKRAPAAVVRTVVQSRARHILLRTGALLTQEAAVARLAAVKQRLQSGGASFAAVAKEVSQDSSAADGGELGWATPGMFVPEFEDAMNHLTDGEISNPVVSRFGVHLIQLVERRRVDLDPRQLREVVRNELREKRYDETFTTWAQDLRARAFVEFRDAPQ
jgi:peptidyl-prolyl cis-trans isomerase SurA